MTFGVSMLFLPLRCCRPADHLGRDHKAAGRFLSSIEHATLPSQHCTKYYRLHGVAGDPSEVHVDPANATSRNRFENVWSRPWLPSFNLSPATLRLPSS